ncbi:hypothetical protein [Tautonia rosea]|nr:hypothetical protein [Tautonia rosea]
MFLNHPTTIDRTAWPLVDQVAGPGGRRQPPVEPVRLAWESVR